MRGLLGVVGFLLDVWAIVSIVNSDAERRTKIIWVLVVAFLPLLGFLIWLAAGPKPARDPRM